MASTDLPETIKALLRREAYSHPVDLPVRLIQTHVSFVLITGEEVYKLKKPVNFGFIDYSTLPRRKRACEAEVRLNRRGCPEIYVGVVPIVETPRGVRVGGRGRVLDYAVHMKRLPEGRMMDELLASDAVTLPMLGQLAERLADFHAAAEGSERITRIGGAHSFATNWRENLQRVAAFQGRTLSARRLGRLQEFAETFLTREQALLRRRDSEGHIRDCHGDLRSDAVCFDERLSGGIGFVDCIEFNDALRYTDTGLDVAFLTMDLAFRDREDLADVLTGFYLTVTGDRELPLLLRAYRCYRAGVRGLVESLTLDDATVSRGQKAAARGRARRYFALAERYGRAAKSADILLIMGLSGSGKSVLAGALASRLGAVLLSTDVVRKELTEGAGRNAPVDAGRYSEEQRGRVYDELLRLAEGYLREGRTVVLDGTYIEQGQRAPVVEMAARLRRKLLLVECEAPDVVIKERQEQRAHEPWTASEGRWDIYLAQRQRYQPPDEIPPELRLLVDTTAPIADQLAAVQARLSRRTHSANARPARRR